MQKSHNKADGKNVTPVELDSIHLGRRERSFIV